MRQLEVKPHHMRRQEKNQVSNWATIDCYWPLQEVKCVTTLQPLYKLQESYHSSEMPFPNCFSLLYCPLKTLLVFEVTYQFPIRVVIQMKSYHSDTNTIKSWIKAMICMSKIYYKIYTDIQCTLDCYFQVFLLKAQFKSK